MMKHKQNDATQSYTIRQLCEEFDLTLRTVRFYEQKDLLHPKRSGNKRIFSRRDRARLKLIVNARRFGLSLNQIHDVLSLYNADKHNSIQTRTAINVAKIRLKEMKAQQQDLQNKIQELQKHIDDAYLRLPQKSSE